MNTLTRYLPYFLAACLPIVMFDWFLPASVGELDRYVLWLIAMVLVGLPVLLAELALARRAGQAVWLGMQTLTREADAPMHWRLFAGLSVLVAMLVAAVLVSGFGAFVRSNVAPAVLSDGFDVPGNVIAAVLMGVALILSLLKARLVAAGALLIIASALVSLVSGQFAVPVMTVSSLGEWAQAVVMALVCVGSGTGLYWFVSHALMPNEAIGHLAAIDPAISQVAINNPNNANRPNKPTAQPLFKTALSVWIIQLIVGLLAMFVTGGGELGVAEMLGGVGVLFVAAYLTYYAYVQAVSRFGLVSGALGVTLVSLVLAALPTQWLVGALASVSLVMVLVLAVFVGWFMKISHLRKSLNFATEARYNLWRVCIRLVVPLAVLMALIGLWWQ